jgi:uncharacterized membrane protein YgcG
MPRPHPSFLKSIVLVTVAALWLGACASNATPSGFIEITAERPIAQSPAGLAVSVNPTTLQQSFGVQINTITPDTPHQAVAAVPAHLRPQGSLFGLRTSGKVPEQVFLSAVVPPQADSAKLDLYAWDGAAWSFLPTERRGGQLIASVAQMPAMVGLFESAPPLPLALTTLEPGQVVTAEASGAVNGALLGGVLIQADGLLTGQLPATPMDRAFALYPIVRNYDANGVNSAALNGLFNDPVTRASHLQSLVSFAISGGYDGLVLDYRGVPPDQRLPFALFVNDLALQLQPQSKSLFVFVEPPAPQAGAAGPWAAFTTGGYDWHALGASADAILAPIAGDPAVYGNGYADALLSWAVGQVNRNRLRLAVSALSVDGANGAFVLRDYASALASLGSARLAEGVTPYAGQAVTATLSGQAQTLDYDPQAFAARFTYADSSGAAHTVWLTSASTLRQRLALAEKYRLGGVVVMDLLQSGVPSDLAGAVNAYKVQLAAEAQAQASLLWTVSDATGVVAQATGQPGQPYVYVPPASGEYQIAAAFQSDHTQSLGAVPVSVANAPAATPTPAVVASTGGGSSGGGSTGSGSGGGSNSGGGFVPPPPVASGSFELGGQVPGFIGHAAQMQQAGMKWVKFQALGDTSGQIAGGHASGFKVLISAVGDRARAADPNYWPEYASWVAGIAAQGADAIEVWNEANLDREWPTGQINGATYTGLLRAAYTAIKAANPNTLVIGGAPAPTGAAGGAGCIAALCNDDVFVQQMAQAGAASYMDCVGIHYNTGTTSPSASTGSALSGYHYSYYFWPMIDLYYNAFGGSRQLCFTELGYLTPEGFGSLSPYFSWAADNTLAEQAQWLAESASLSASSGKVRLMIIFNVDFTVYGDDPQAGYAIIRPDGSCPACAALDAVMP